MAGNQKKKLIVLSAPSGAGKSTLANLLLSKEPSHFALSISHTTRPPRAGEKEGVHYFFVSHEEFQKKISQGEFLEHAQVFGKYFYGTSKLAVEKELKAGTKNILFDIDVQGAENLKKTFGKDCLTVFIQPPSFEELERRLRLRATEKKEDIDARLKTAKQELAKAHLFDHQLVNSDLEKTYNELVTLLKKESCL